MRKVDYEILAAAVAKHRASAQSYASMVSDKEGAAFERGRAAGHEEVARTFARFAHVDKRAFLEACGLTD